MKIDNDTVRHVAKVAKLNLTEKEMENFVPQLKEVLEKFSQIKKVDTENVAPSFHPVPLKNNYREDNIQPALSKEEALRNSKHKKESYFKGPRIL